MNKINRQKRNKTIDILHLISVHTDNLHGHRNKILAAHKAMKGEGWAHAPFGKAKDQAGLLVDDPAEQESVRAVLALRSEGKTIRAIVSEMNERGIQTRGGGRWHITSIQRVLKRHGKNVRLIQK